MGTDAAAYLREQIHNHRDLVDQLERLFDAISDDEVEGVDAEALSQYRKLIASGEDMQIEAAIWLIKEADATESMLKEEADRIAKARKRNKAKRLFGVDTLRELVEDRGGKAKVGVFSVYTKTAPEYVSGKGEAALMPDRFVKVTREISKSAIKKAIKAGETVEGFSLFRGPKSVVIQ